MAAPAATSTSEEWSCLHCTFINNEHMERCEICFEDKSSSPPTPNKSEPDRECVSAPKTPTKAPKPMEYVEIESWQCGRCTASNVMEEKQCTVCQHVDSRRYRQCEKCTFVNDVDSEICSVCNYRAFHVHCEDTNALLANLSALTMTDGNHDRYHDESKEEAVYSQMKTDSKIYNEQCNETQIKTKVEGIAKLVVSSISIASGPVGALQYVGNLAQQIMDSVVHAGWSTSQNNEKITKRFCQGDVYVYFEMERSVQTSRTGVMGFGRRMTDIRVSVKYVYLVAGNQTARNKLQALTRKEVDALAV